MKNYQPAYSCQSGRGPRQNLGGVLKWGTLNPGGLVLLGLILGE